MRAGSSMGTSTTWSSMPGHLWDYDTYTCLAQSHLEPHPHPQSLGLTFYDLRLSPSELPPSNSSQTFRSCSGSFGVYGLWYPPFFSFFLFYPAQNWLVSCLGGQGSGQEFQSSGHCYSLGKEVRGGKALPYPLSPPTSSPKRILPNWGGK